MIFFLNNIGILLEFYISHLADQFRNMLDVRDLFGLTIVQACSPSLISLHAVFNLMMICVNSYFFVTRTKSNQVCSNCISFNVTFFTP